MIIEIQSEEEMKAFGKRLGLELHGGEVVELVGDIGAGKTTLTKGIASGLGITDNVQSPTFTISRIYDARDGLQLAHYDFYRLQDAGIMDAELYEVARDPSIVTVIEWSEIVSSVLPDDHIVIRITSPTERSRRLTIEANEELRAKL